MKHPYLLTAKTTAEKDWRNLGKNKSREFYLYITHSSG